MACINPDGTISETGKKILGTLTTPMTAEDVANVAEVPVFRARSSLRQLVEGGLVRVDGDKYMITSTGKEKIS